jgi:hypothetical protein
MFESTKYWAWWCFSKHQFELQSCVDGYISIMLQHLDSADRVAGFSCWCHYGDRATLPRQWSIKKLTSSISVTAFTVRIAGFLVSLQWLSYPAAQVRYRRADLKHAATVFAVWVVSELILQIRWVMVDKIWKQLNISIGSAYSVVQDNLQFHGVWQVGI